MSHQKSPGLLSKQKIVTGWGLNKKAIVDIYEPIRIDQIQEIIINALPKSLIARGLGRSYGDAAQLNKKSVIDLKAFKKISTDPIHQTVTASAGVSFEQLMQSIIPKGFFLPVTPGTRSVTVGGAIAADVHGKNHHSDGSFGRHLNKLVLVDGNGEIKELSPTQNDEAQAFWATIGGMGLTGIILEATFSVIPIKTSKIKVDTYRYNYLEALMEAMIASDKLYRYSVAWIDSLDRKGRGVLTCGEHAEIDEVEINQNDELLSFNPKSLASAPNFMPSGLLNRFSVKAFNEAWYRKSPKLKKNELQNIGEYFHPLDGIQNWNRIYGPQGFIQYQFVVPDHASYLIPKTLNALREIGAPSFLTVLKRLGDNNQGHLSFPIKGWTLAIDVPASLKNLEVVLSKLDEEIADVGGKIYLAKDSRQSVKTFNRCYPRVDEWKQIKASLDPKCIFASDASQRLNLT